MKKAFLFIFTMILLASCQKEESIAPIESKSLEEEHQTSYQTNLGHVSPSILNSSWWKDLHPTTQKFMSIELSSEEDPITYSELQNLLKTNLERVSTRAKNCPGYPVANPAGDVTLNSQADVNAFGALKCKNVIGTLAIVDTLGPDPICDLSPLKGIKSVGSNLTVNADCLTNLNGLEKIKSVGKLGPFGFIGILGSSLTDISALSKLNTVTGSINIIDCDNLTSISSAFSNITAVESGQTSAPLTSIYVLNINDNASLTDISGFGNISNIEGGLRILNNGALQDLDDLSGLNTIGDDIFILDNLSLQNVDELSNITTLADDLFVFGNLALTQCCGLYNLLCNDAPACTTSGVGDLVAIFGNGAGCTDVDIVAGGPCP